MTIASWMRPNRSIPLAIVLLGGGFTFSDGQARNGASGGAEIIWVYTVSLCERPGDASACTVQPVSPQPAFATHQDCDAHREADLGKQANPRLLGICRRHQQV
jgi:hypothetical protein